MPNTPPSGPNSGPKIRGFRIPWLLIIVLVVIGGVLAINIPCMLASHSAMTAEQAQARLKTVAVAQKLYFEQHGTYADSARVLSQGGDGSALDSGLVGAFSQCGGNLDRATPAAVGGYLYRMIPCDDPTSGKKHWCAIARPVNRDEGDVQFFITEEETCYDRQEPRPGQKGAGEFLLERLADVFRKNGTLDWMKLEPLDWRPSGGAH